MGLEFFLSSKAILSFLIFSIFSTYLIGKIFRDSLKNIGCFRLSYGFLGVLLVNTFWAGVYSEFKLKNFIELIVLQSYIAFPWVIYFVFPIFLSETAKSTQILHATLSKIGFIIFIICILFLLNDLTQSSELSWRNILTIVNYAAWLLSISYAFCFFCTFTKKSK